MDKAKTNDRKALMRAIHSGVYSPAFRFPLDLYREYCSGLVTREDVLSMIIAEMYHAPLLDITANKTISLTMEEANIIWGWLEKTVGYKKAILFYENGISSDDDITNLATLIMARAMIAVDKALANSDPQITNQILPLAVRAFYDDKALKQGALLRRGMTQSVMIQQVYGDEMDYPKLVGHEKLN